MATVNHDTDGGDSVFRTLYASLVSYVGPYGKMSVY